MVSTVNVQLRLMVSFDDGTTGDYWGIRESDAEVQAMQDAQDYLYQALHGWGGDPEATQFANMEKSANWDTLIDVVGGTDLPVRSEIPAAVNAALETYEGEGFGLAFESLAGDVAPTGVRWRRKGKQLYVDYEYELVVKTGVQNDKQCNWLPLDAAKPVPPVLQPLQDAKIVAHYRILARVTRDPES